MFCAYRIAINWCQSRGAIILHRPNLDQPRLSAFVVVSLQRPETHKQRTSPKIDATVSTHISVCNIHFFVYFWISFRNANTVSSAIECRLPVTEISKPYLLSAGQRALVSQSHVWSWDWPYLLPCISTQIWCGYESISLRNSHYLQYSAFLLGC